MAKFTPKGAVSQHEQIMEIVKAIPGSRLSEITTLVDFRRESVSARLTQLKREGRVRYEDGKYYPGDGKPQPIITKKLRMPKEKVENLTLKQTLDAALEQVANLQAWQEFAIKRYPDLAVKPEIMAARKIAQEYYEQRGDKQKASDIRAGKHDDAPFMHMILAAMA
jgi:hypothetical protein